MLNIQPPDIQYGDVYWAALPGYGNGKSRPWIVISDNVQNNGAQIQVIPSTTHKPSCMTPAIVEVTFQGKELPSYIKCGHVHTIDRELFGNWEAQLTPQDMTRVLAGVEAARNNLRKPIVRTHQPQGLDALPEWEDILSKPIEEQDFMVTNFTLRFTVQELAKHWDIHPQTLYVRLQRHAKRVMRPINVPHIEHQAAPPIIDLSPMPTPDLEATMLGAYLIKLLDPKKKYHILLREVK